MLQIATSSVPTSDPAPDNVTSLLALLTTVLRARRLIVRFAIVAAIVTAGITLLQARRFVSAAGIVAQGGRAPSGLSGLAAQFGVSVGGADAGNSPAFVAKLLGAPELLRELAMDSLKTSSGATVVVASLYPGPTEDAAQQADRVATALADDIRVADEPETGVIRVRATATDAPTAAALILRLVSLGDSVLVMRRQQVARADAQYAAARQQQAAGALRSAEDALQSFLSHNRQFSTPELTMERDRLQRDVTAREGVLTALSQSAEQSRIEADRPTPVLGYVEPPSLPSLPIPRGLLVRLVLALVGGAMLGACLALFRASLTRQASHEREMGDAFAEASQETWFDLVRPWRLVSRGPRDPSSKRAA